MAKQDKKGKAVTSLLDQMAGLTVSNVASDSALNTVAALAQQQYDAAMTVAKLEDQLRDAKRDLMRIATEDLPAAMKECGVTEFTTKEGLKISIKPDITCAIKVADRELAYQWLIDHQFAGIIKSEIGIAFNREHLEDAMKLADEIREMGFDVDFSQNIHPQTLKAFVKERMADTETKPEDAFPLDLFGARPYDVAVVKPRK